MGGGGLGRGDFDLVCYYTPFKEKGIKQKQKTPMETTKFFVKLYQLEKTAV